MCCKNNAQVSVINSLWETPVWGEHKFIGSGRIQNALNVLNSLNIRDIHK